MEAILKQINLIFRTVLTNDTLEITEKTSATHIDNWNSLNHVLLIAAIEEAFDVVFDLDEMIAFETVGDILNAIKIKKGDAF